MKPSKYLILASLEEKAENVPPHRRAIIAKRLRASIVLVTFTGKSGKFFPKQGGCGHIACLR